MPVVAVDMSVAEADILAAGTAAVGNIAVAGMPAAEADMPAAGTAAVGNIAAVDTPVAVVGIQLEYLQLFLLKTMPNPATHFLLLAHTL